MKKLTTILISLFVAAIIPATVSLTQTAQAQEAVAVREVEIVVDGGYQPNRIVAKEGEKLRLVFVRKDPSPCSKEVLIPSLSIRKDLPLNQKTVIDLPDLKPGEIEFRCGMNMLKGLIVVEPKLADRERDKP